ncbi:MAG TPA: sigma 54-interacting transcriptional regulator [Calditerricola sp.]
MEPTQKLNVKQLSAILEAAQDGIYVVDGSGVTLFVNRAYEAITGYKREELIGRNMAELVNQGYFDRSVSLLVLKTRSPQSLIQRIGKAKEVLVTGTPVFDESGAIALVVTSVRDISQLNDLRRELEKARSFQALQHHRYTFDAGGTEHTLVCQSPRMRQLVETIRQIAPYPTSVLLTGPTGVGKEVLAHLIHQLSDRKDKPFIKVNCGAIPEALLESELFGYEPGAFTGARREGKIGLFELADGGTLLLDEIGDMPLPLQVKLLRVLESREVWRIGATRPRTVNVRILSATNQNLAQLVREGRFREDLYYRLNVIELAIPPLRERPEDLDALVEHYLNAFNRQYRLDKTLSAAARRALRAYHWPGNVRELRNLIENLVVSLPDPMIDEHHLPPHIRRAASGDDGFGCANASRTLKERVEQFEKQLIADALARSPSLRQAAKRLGIDHSTLVKKMKRYGLTAPRPTPATGTRKAPRSSTARLPDA